MPFVCPLQLDVMWHVGHSASIFFVRVGEKRSWWRNLFPDFSATRCISKNFCPPFQHLTQYSITPSLWRLSRGPHWHRIADTIRTQSKWLFTPPTTPTGQTTSTSLRSSMDLKSEPFYCIVTVQKDRVHLCGWSMQSYNNALCSHQRLQCCTL